MAEDKAAGSDGARYSGRSRWLVGALLVSLMANMVVVGIAAGRMWAHYHHHDRGHGWHDGRGRGGGGMHAFLDRLPEARRAELRRLMPDKRELGQAGREAMRAAHQAVRDAIVSEPFDKAVLEAALARVNKARADTRGQLTAGFAEFLAAMTSEERKLFAETGLRRRGRGRHDEM